MRESSDSLNTRRSIEIGGTTLHYYSLDAAEDAGAGAVTRLPRSLKVLYENLLRHEDGFSVRREDLLAFARSVRSKGDELEIAFHPTRVMMNDSAGIPLMADFAALRGAMTRNGGDPKTITPVIQSDLIVDHSVMVDRYGTADAVEANLDLEFERNGGRYSFLRWAQQNFDNFRVVPPGTGICHQVNVEALARCIWTARQGERTYAFPETLLGTDSHTPMINCLGILGWGVGGIEGGSAMLGQPVSMTVPRVVGCHLAGRLRPGVTATDLVLTIVERLRAYGVVGSFVEYFGPGLGSLSLSDRATLANMAPEYGATMGFFPIDGETVRYLGQTARGGAHLALVETYARVQGLWHDPNGPQPDFNETVEVDLDEIVPSIAGPKRPQDRINLPEVARAFEQDVMPGSAELPEDGAPVENEAWTLDHGHVVIAAITSCTNTSNPSVMLAAGLLAKNAVERGLKVKPWVKTSLSPGSLVVADYLKSTGLQEPLDALGFNLTGFGCMTCMGNSGPLQPEIAKAIEGHDVTATAVLSGNRNFEGRIHPLARTNYIGSPPLVVAYALAGSMRVDLTRDPLGTASDGAPVYLADIWPTPEELDRLADSVLVPERYEASYATMFDGDRRWQDIRASGGDTYEWPNDNYMKEPPFFLEVGPELPPTEDIVGARPLVLLADSITTDHISPVGTITATSAAGQYLIDQGVPPEDFNSFAARRVNHDVMIRGAFANIRIQNQMVPDRRGGWARHEPSGEVMPIHEAAARYRAEGVPLVVVAGRDYGQGSSRDWAAKGTRLLGARAVIAEGFERIHRSNLIGLGVLPLQFAEGTSWTNLGMDGTETIDVRGISGEIDCRMPIEMTLIRSSGATETVPLICRLDTKLEVEYYRHGGILHYVLRQRINAK